MKRGSSKQEWQRAHERGIEARTTGEKNPYKVRGYCWICFEIERQQISPRQAALQQLAIQLRKLGHDSIETFKNSE